MATTAEALDAGYRAFRGPAAGLDDAAHPQPWLGTWNLSRCLAHLEGWSREMPAAIQCAAHGERPMPKGASCSGADTWDEWCVLDAKPGRAAPGAWDAACHACRPAAAPLPGSLHGDDPERGRPPIGNWRPHVAGIHHFAEHQAGLESWLRSRK